MSIGVDYVNVPWHHETKNTKKPLFQQWARKAHAKSTPWVVLWKGDTRKSDPGEGPLVVMPLRLYEEIIMAIVSSDDMFDSIMSDIARNAGEPA